MRPPQPRLDDPDNLRAIADDTYDWETWFAPDGQALWVNPAVERMTGHSVAGCLAMPDYPLPLVHAEDRERIGQVLAGARRGSSGNDVEFRVLRADGAAQWVAMSWQGTVNRRGEALGFRTSVRDIHDRKQLELQLRGALRTAHAAERAKDEFLAMMSHELRTPLQSIQGYAELMAGLERDPEQLRRLQVVLGQTQQLAGLLENVLDLSALQAGAPALNLSAVSVGALVQGVCESLRPRAEQAGLALRLERTDGDEQQVRTDPRALQQIVLNLVHNAVKFTERGEVRVRTGVQPAAAGGLEVTIAVQDTGPGIPEAWHGRIFEPFARADDAPGQAPGSGLGLSIARRLADALGAALTVDSRPGQGSTFQVRLSVLPAGRFDPRWDGPAGSPELAPLDPEFAARHPLRILVAEDSAPARELLCEVLQRHGYQPRLAATGPQALDWLSRDAYDLVLMDLQLPGMDGATVVARLRGTWEAGRGPRVVALTAGLLERSRRELLGQGFDAVLLKPISILHLQRLLRWAAGAGDEPKPNLRPDVLADLDVPGADGRSMLPRIAGRVQRQLLEQRARLAEALQARDTARVARLAHGIRGDCLLVGASHCAQSAAALEALAARPGPDPVAPAPHDDLEAAVTALERALSGLHHELTQLQEPAR